MSCIGTAGHIDHGKSTLVEALTGIDPDRLAEEKARGMTIDLGFAWLTLPDGREVSIVDVPGHEGFIKNMLAGVGGIDAALLVVAADEGIMPQTREHLAILDLLRVRRGVVALTKADLVDEEWLELVYEEVAGQLKPTTLAGARILPVSAHTRQGLPALLAELAHVLDETEERQDGTRPRLPIDRTFTMTGFGTVVTGTLLDGTLRVGQDVEIQPQGLRTRIRTLQTHRREVEVAHPGSRVAINLAGIARTDVRRGDVVSLPGQFQPTLLLDARLQLLPDEAIGLAHNTRVDFYSGAQEVPARVRLLDVESLEAGQQAWAQLRLSRPVVVARADRFIVRIPSPAMTIGGGEVVDVHPRYHRRYQPALIQALEALERGTPQELILALLERRGELYPRKAGPATSNEVAGKPSTVGRPLRGLSGYELTEIARQSNLAQDVTLRTLETLLRERRVRKVGRWWFAQSLWDVLCARTTDLLREQHRQYPLRSGLSKEEWRTRLGLAPRMAADVFLALLEEAVLVEAPVAVRALGATSGLVRLPDFTPAFTAEQQQQVARLLQTFRANPSLPPGRAEIEIEVDSEVLSALLEQGTLVRLGSVAEPVFFLRESYDEMVGRLVSYLREHGTITVAQARDLLGTTRKYILPLLEHLDERRITRRQGDQRLLGRAP
ncbi:MAG TPA: selenocysteine-specific translation elongation factor [Ktedonobacteraceae bacterium]|jgi:selenocysteine-specific elongation factor